MPLPTRSDVLTLDYTGAAQPAAYIEAKTLSPSSATLDYTLAAQPVFGLPGAATTGYSITAFNGTYLLSGKDATLSFDRLLAAQNGTYLVSGQDATLSYSAAPTGYSITAVNGAYSISGQNAALSFGRLLSAQNGVYSVAGQTVDISAGAPPAPTLGIEFLVEIRSFTERRRF